MSPVKRLPFSRQIEMPVVLDSLWEEKLSSSELKERYKMAIRSVIYPEFEVVRYDRCTRCGRCIKECANGVHFFSQDKKMVLSDDTKCVDCLRCIAFCPEHAIKIVKRGCSFRDNAYW